MLAMTLRSGALSLVFGMIVASEADIVRSDDVTPWCLRKVRVLRAARTDSVRI